MGSLDLKGILQNTRDFFVGYTFLIIETLAACLFVITGKEVLGVVFFVVLICLFLVVCQDIFATTLPFLLTCTIATNCYDSYHIFMPMAKFAPVVIACLLCRFSVYKKPFIFGQSGRGLLAVSLAVALGGMGRFSFIDYVYGAYYIFGLGIGMYAVYLMIRAEFQAPRRYDVREKFSVVMILTGIVCAVMIARGYYRYTVGEIPRLYPEGFSRNNLSTLLMFCMPFPLLFSHKNRFVVMVSLGFYAAILSTTSRGGLLFGGVELAVCFWYWIFSQKGKERLLRLSIFFILVAVAALFFWKTIYGIITERLLNKEEFRKDARRIMLAQAIERFLKSPVSGYGILDRTIEYEIIRKKGALTWYHMMIPQIIGSMGLVGVLAYSYQFIDRVRLIFQEKNAWSMVLGISYLGILLMSQVNPGEFCPLPFGLLTVLLFVFQETRLSQSNNGLLLRHIVKHDYSMQM